MNSKSLRFYTLSGLVYVFSSSIAIAADWLPPFQKNEVNPEKISVGDFLEKSFSEVLSDCGIPKLEKVNIFKNEPLTSIPDILQTNLDLSRIIVPQGEEAIGRLFSYIYSGGNVEQKTDSEGRLLNIDAIVNPEAMLPEGIDSVVHTHSCSSIVNAAANGNFSMSLPPAALTAALKSEYSGKKQLALALVAGKFKSPLSQALSSIDDAQRLHSRLLIWDWYLRNTPADDDKPYYLTSINGITIFKFLVQKRDSKGMLSFQASTTTPFGSAEASIQNALATTSETEIKKYSTAAYKINGVVSGSDKKMEPLISVDKLTSEIGAFSTKVRPGYSSTLVKGKRNVHAQYIAGVPRSFCQRDRWLVQGNGLGVGELELMEATPSSTPGNGCLFQVSFDPIDSIFGKASASIKLDYKFVGQGAFKGKTVELKAEKVVFSTTKSPEIFPLQFDPLFRKTDIGSGNYKIEWEIDHRVIDDADTIDWTQLVSAPITNLSCEGGGVFPVVVVISTNKEDKVAKIKANYIVYPANNLDLDKPTATCKLVGNVRLPIRSLDGQPAWILENPLREFFIKFPSSKQVVATEPNAIKVVTN